MPGEVSLHRDNGHHATRIVEMTLQFLNPLMLWGLALVLLPVLVHLLSRRRHDVVVWGAMQFLALGRTERRRVRIEQLLLLLIRMVLIALLALAMARPYIVGGMWSAAVTGQRRDVVLIIDGSYSMGRERDAQTPQAAAVEGAYDLLETLQQGDTVCLIDARESPRMLIDVGIRDFDRARRELDNLPAPSGSSDLVEAMFQAVGALGSGSNVSRDIIVFTDGQALPWRVEDGNAWTRLEALTAEQSVRPSIWVVNVAGKAASEMNNFSVAPLQVSRESAIVDVPLKVRTTIRHTGDQPPSPHQISLEVDGLRLGSETQEIDLSTREAVVEFEYTPKSPGSHLVSIVLEGDALPADDRAHAALYAREALPILLVDGDPHADPTQSETFFAAAALTPQSNDSPWIQAQVVSLEQLGSDILEDVQVVVLANVPQLSRGQTELLHGFVSNGGGLLLAPGDRVKADSYNRLMFDSPRRLLPAMLDSIADYSAEDQSKRISTESLGGSWLQRFQEAGDLMQARISRVWKVAPIAALPDSAPDSADANASNASPRKSNPSVEAEHGPAAVVVARLENGAPLLIQRDTGRGRVLLVTVPLDADWTNLPTRSDYVTFLHEVIFHLAQSGARHNIAVGETLLLAVPSDFSFEAHTFHGPDGRTFPIALAGTGEGRVASLSDTWLPGIYTLKSRSDSSDVDADRGRHFVVRSHAAEWNLMPLDDSDIERLSRDGRMAIVGSTEELTSQLYADDSATEIGHLLILLLLLLLMGETLLSRHLVRGGHVQIESTHVAEPPSRPQHSHV